VFGVDPAGRHCLDIGSSTGGFTDVLLARGARRIVAIDVGVGQLHPRLREDKRVVSHESTDARNLDAALVIEPPTLIVCDASFIGLAKLLTRPLELAAPDAMLVALFKPQFEVGPANVGTGGIVSRPAAVAAAADELERWLAKVGWVVRQWSDSAITGADGNRERLFVARNY
jgi:23S rRNA (cytidine1920-2'-O)/16S rRNA (cytidine1409-2'-O)-methyltransferase